MKFLKDHVKAAGGVLLLQIESIGEKHANKNGKFVKHVTFKIKSTSTTIAEDVFAIKFEKFGLQGATIGDNVEAYFNAEGYLDYRLVGANAESSAPASQSPAQQVAAERAATESIRAAEHAAKRESISKIIFGYMNTEMAKGKTPGEAQVIALEALQKQEAAVEMVLPSSSHHEG